MSPLSSKRERVLSGTSTVIQGNFPYQRQRSSQRATVGDKLEIIIDEYTEYRRYEPTGTYVTRSGREHRLFLDTEEFKDLFPSVYAAIGTIGSHLPSQYVGTSLPGSREDLPLLSGGLRSWLQCGATSLPLKVPCNIKDPSFGELFGISPAPNWTENEVQREAIRQYIALEAKAAKGTLSDQEIVTWQKICGIVDRKKMISLREIAKPRRSLGQIIMDSEGRRTVKWASGLVVPLSAKAVSAIDILDVGEWFEADVLQDPEGAIVDLRNIDIREDYRLASDGELRDFLIHRKM